MERNAGGMAHTPFKLHKKQLDDPDISPVFFFNGMNLAVGLLLQRYALQVPLQGTIGMPGICCKLKMFSY